MNKIISKFRGFTLIELLIVVAIIGILSALIMANIASSRAKARDAKRISDVAQLQLALEQYFSKNNKYPSVAGGLEAALVPTYISAMPKHPLTGLTTNYIQYATEGQNDYDYTLAVGTEKPVADGLGGNRKGFICNPNDDSNIAQKPLLYCVEPK